MNQLAYKLHEFSLRKSLFIFVCLANKSGLSRSLSMIIKPIKFKHNNVFVSNVVRIKRDLTIHNITFF